MNKKIVVGIAVSIGLAAILLTSLLMQGPSYSVYLRSLHTGNSGFSIDTVYYVIPGNTFTGTYLKVGFNKGGTIGVGNTSGGGPGTGFQYPIGAGYESLAIWWWGEGYCVAYKTYTSGSWVDNIAYWQPSYGWPIPSSCNIRAVSHTVLRDDDNMKIVKTVVRTTDGVLQLTFTWTFPVDQKYVILSTEIKKIGSVRVRDILYKRFVDWDVHQSTVDNDWTSDAHSAYAYYYNTTEFMGYLFTVSGDARSQYVPYVDLDGWYDAAISPVRGPGYTVQSHGTALTFDGAAAIHFAIGSSDDALESGPWVVALYYQASEADLVI